MFELFINPWLLGGLAFASLPIIIHLLNKRRFIVHDWAAMDFLLQAQVMNRRRVRLEDLILLLLRIAIILLIVFTVARPVIQGLGSWNEDERIIVIDDSGSMSLIGTTGSLFDEGCESAVSQSRDAFASSIPVSLRYGARPSLAFDVQGLIAMGTPEGEAAAKAGSDLLDQIEREKSVDSALQFPEILDSVLDAARADKSPRRRRLVLVSDFREGDWLGADGKPHEHLRAAFEELRHQELEDQIRFQWINVGHYEVENVGISEFRVTSEHALTGVPVRIIVEVTNYGETVRERVEGEVEVGRPDVSPFRVVQRIPLPPIERLAAGESKRVEIQHLFSEAGQYPLRSRIENDRLTRDDESYLILPVRMGLRVVVFDGDPHEERMLSESGFLIAALLPRGDESTGILPVPMIRGSKIRGNREITAASLEGADVALVLNRSEVNPAEIDVLCKFVEKGGGLAFFLGDQVDAAAYETIREQSARDGEATLFPASAKGVIQAERGTRHQVKVAETGHPLFRVFQGIEGISIELAKFSKHMGLEPQEEARVLASYDDAAATPMIIESERGRGKILVLNTTADRGWSDWPTDLSYPIFLQELARYLAPSRNAERQIAAGEPIVWDVTPGFRYSVVAPDGSTHVVQHDVEQASPLLSFHDTQRAGFYRVTRTSLRGGFASSEPSSGSGYEDRTEVDDGVWFACRWHERESELGAMEEEDLKKLMDSYGLDSSFGGETDAEEYRESQEGEVWRFLAMLAAVFLLLELFLAWWFGRK